MKRARKTGVKVNHFKDKLCNAFRIQFLSCENKSNSDNTHGTLLPESLGQKTETTGVIEF